MSNNVDFGIGKVEIKKKYLIFGAIKLFQLTEMKKEKNCLNETMKMPYLL